MLPGGVDLPPPASSLFINDNMAVVRSILNRYSTAPLLLQILMLGYGEGWTSWGPGGSACPADFASRTLSHTYSKLQKSYLSYVSGYVTGAWTWLKEEGSPTKKMRVTSLEQEDGLQPEDDLWT